MPGGIERKQTVYSKLRDEITSLKYKPGEELDMNEIAGRLGVSRSPVRDALIRLSTDRLVDIFPQKGTRVSLLDREILRQERFMRTTIEMGVIESCMEALSYKAEREIFTAKLGGNLLSQHASALSSDIPSFMRYDDEMHRMIYTKADCAWIWETLVSRTGNDSRIRMLSYGDSGAIARAEEEHKRIADAITCGDVSLVKELDRAHLSRIFDELDELERRNSSFFKSRP